jgi:glycosyltransferase involved in cell wall biosynthesis
LGLGDAVQLLGGMDFSAIRLVADEASFYLQTSVLEGMAMSVVEAMQLGLVPVVTPVGEIAHYSHHGENAVVVTDDVAAVADVLALLEDDERYQAMRKQAMATWADKPLYKDSVLAACREVLGIAKAKA